MNTYRVSFNLESDDLETFLKTVGPHCGRMSVTHVYAMPDPIVRAPEPAPVAEAPEPAPVAEAPPPAPIKRRQNKKAIARRKRFSKVNSAILTALQDGPKSSYALKRALLDAGLAESSISTGARDLTKAGKIMRDSASGLYHLQTELPLEAPVEESAAA
jgi:hypothetical protein